MPLTYELRLMFTTEAILAKNKVNLDKSKWNWAYLAQIVSEFRKKNPGKYFFNSQLDFKSVILSSGLSFVDYKNKKENFNSKDFIYSFADLILQI